MLCRIDQVKVVALGDGERGQHDDAHAGAEEAAIDRDAGLEDEACGPGLR